MPLSLTSESFTPPGGSSVSGWGMNKSVMYTVTVYMTGRRLDVEALPTTACSLDVGVVKHELAGEFRLDEIHLGAQQGQLSLLLDENSHT